MACMLSDGGVIASRSTLEISEAYLELVLACLRGRSWVEKIYGENLDRQNFVSTRYPICLYPTLFHI